MEKALSYHFADIFCTLTNLSLINVLKRQFQQRAVKCLESCLKFNVLL